MFLSYRIYSPYFQRTKKSDLFEIGLCSANIFIKYTLPSDLIKRFAVT